MGISSSKSIYARYRHAPDRFHGSGKAQAHRGFGRKKRLFLGLSACLISALLANFAAAESIRIASFNTELKRRGPGVLLRDILSGKDPQVTSVANIISHISPDILLINGFDFDTGNVALASFANLLAKNGTPYSHLFALRPNRGMRTGLDMDGDGKTGTPRDAQGYGAFQGQNGMAILSRFPIDRDNVQDFSAMLWVDFPNALLPEIDGKPFPSSQALNAQRLSTTGHWVVPITLPAGTINLLAFHATPPVFDGDEDRNGKRNHDEVTFWISYLDGKLQIPPMQGPFVILGNANLDPHDGDGRTIAMQNLLTHPALQDPKPSSLGAVIATQQQGGVNKEHKTDPALDTVDWRDDPGPGNMRVDYVLPSADLTVTASGVFWPEPDSDAAGLLGTGDTAASRHRLVWVDIILQR